MEEKRLTHQETADLCRGLALLLHAGIGLGDGLHLLAEDEQESRRELLEEMGRLADRGGQLSDAMEESGRFGPYVCGMVRVGERTGRLEEALQTLSDYYEERAQMDHHLRSALVYPAILMLLVLVVVAVLLIRVLPIFEDVYASLGGQLTGLAGGLLRLGQGMKTILPLLLVLLFAAADLVLLFAGSERFRSWALAFWQRKNGHRGVAAALAQAHTAQALALGLGSGLPLEEAVALSAQLQEHPETAARCEACAKRLLEGAELSEALGEAELLPASSCRMLMLGMRGGSGDRTMAEIAYRLTEDARRALEKKVAQVEPTIVLTASLLVGAVLLSVMLPLMHIMSAIG